LKLAPRHTWKTTKEKIFQVTLPGPPIPKLDEHHKIGANNKRGGSQLHQNHPAKKPKLPKKYKRERGNKRNPNPETQKRKDNEMQSKQ